MSTTRAARSRTPTRSRRVRRLAVALTILATLLLLVPGCADGLFYRPSGGHRVYGTPGDYGVTAQEVSFAATDGPRLHGWWLPAVGPARGTVVYCHGNHANLTLHARYVSWLPRHGYQVLVFDYRGYGQSAGSPTRAGTVADTIAAIDFALDRDPTRTVVFGHSLGGALAIVAAAERGTVRAVIAESTFPSYRAIAREKASFLSFLVPLLVSDGHDPEDALDRIPPRPLLVIHGTADGIVPYELGAALHDAAGEPKSMLAVEGGGHATPWLHNGPLFEGMVLEFLSDALD